MKILNWVILLCSFSIGSWAIAQERVLVVLPGVNYLTVQDGQAQKKHPTGYFLSELATPVKYLRQLDIKIVLATPGGVAPVMDPISDDPKWFSSPDAYSKAKDFAVHEVNRPQVALESLNARSLESFSAVFVPGGHAALEEFPTNATIGSVLSYFHRARKPAALICHGPVALLSVESASGEWIYSGYQMTVFSTAEEKIEEDAGALGGKVQFYVQDALASRGGLLSVAQPWTSHVVRDRELITGQNPMSDFALAEALVEAIAEQKISRMTSRSWSGSINPLRGGNELLDVLPGGSNPAVWKDGYTTFFVGTRKVGVTSEQFSSALASHIRQINELFDSEGLRGYLVLASGDYEIAYQNWTSQDAAQKAFAKSGDEISRVVATFMDSAIFKQANSALAIKH